MDYNQPSSHGYSQRRESYDRPYSSRDPPSYSRDQSNFDNRKRKRDTLDPLKLEYLLDLKEYAQYLDLRLEKDELDIKYDQYKTSFLIQQNEKFFIKNQTSEWFRERYHPDCVKIVGQEKERRAIQLTRFLQEMQKGTFDNVNFDVGENESEQELEGRFEKWTVPYSPALFLQNINDTVTRAELDSVTCANPVYCKH
jgi:hypothetical protein